jgi:RNA polymerase sigma-70 factor (ECF subfamily)
MAQEDTIMEDRDEDLMVRVKTSADAGAFAMLFIRWEGAIQEKMTRMAGNPHWGEDLKQEAFARLFTRRASYKPSGSFSGYLGRMARNVCLDELRKNTRREKRMPIRRLEEEFPGWDAHPCHEPTPHERLIQAEEGEMVRQSLARLPQIYRSVLLLRYYGGLKNREIAVKLNILIGTVNSRMAEGLRRLSGLLKARLE